MKPIAISFAAFAILSVAACNIFKKAPKPAPVPPSPPVTPTPRIAPSVRSSDGVFVPGNAELLALQATNKEVTMQVLLEGHTLYTGVCKNCHSPKSIYSRPEAAWPDILTAMAREASITDKQKDAIYKYVLAIKATQPK
jgi:hypothetical protein